MFHKGDYGTFAERSWLFAKPVEHRSHAALRHEEVPGERVRPPLNGVVREHLTLAFLDDLARVAEDVVSEFVGQGKAYVALGKVAAGQNRELWRTSTSYS